MPRFFVPQEGRGLISSSSNTNRDEKFEIAFKRQSLEMIIFIHGEKLGLFRNKKGKEEFKRFKKLLLLGIKREDV